MPIRHTVLSIAKELVACGHYGRAAILRGVEARIRQLELGLKLAMSKPNNIIRKLQAELAAALEREKHSILVDDDDVKCLAEFDDEGQPLPPSDPPPTIADVTAIIKEDTAKMENVLPATS